MSFIGTTLGIGSQANNPSQGASGVNYQAQSTDLAAPSTADQASQLYGQAQTGIGQQQSFLDALKAQNGVQNQSSVYNQLQGVTNGTGPNPAQAMLNQQTGQNVANQGALMASQRGSGSNPALLARQAAQQGAATQQQAIGQGASLQAQQSLNALGQQAGIANTQVANQAGATTGLNQTTQNEQQNVLNGIQGQNNANVAMQSNINSANAGIANTVAQGQQATTGGIMSGIGSAISGSGSPLGSLLAKGGKVSKPKALMADGGIPSVSMPQMQQDLSAGLQAAPASPSSAPSTGPSSNAGQSLAGYNNNNQNAGQPQTQAAPSGASSGAQGLYNGWSSLVGSLGSSKSGSGGGGGSSSPMSSSPIGGLLASGAGGGGGAAGGISSLLPLLAMAAKGGKVPALVSPGERYLPPKEVKKVMKGDKNPMKAGEKIPGKPKVAGAKDSYANDTVPKTLQEGGLVLPRSVTQSKDPGKAARAFVNAHMAQNAMKRK